jgi:proteasome lid subunit RPN8/RPN11
MRKVRIAGELLERIKAEAVAGYPDEVCGFLFSSAANVGGELRAVTSAEAAPNEFDGERHRRFVIPAGELRLAEARGERRDEVVVGFYHSHPDHPAVPSAFDVDHAWPWYTYLVVSVEASGPKELGAFELDAERRRFVPCDLTLAPMPLQVGPETMLPPMRP